MTILPFLLALMITVEDPGACPVDVRLNHVQFIGTHNSYKLDITPELAEMIEQINPGGSKNIRYGHQTITYQLEQIGIRKFELDVFLDPDGGRFAQPAGALATRESDYIDHPEMLQPGLKVMHAQDVDYRTTCRTFIGCLQEIYEWSEQNPHHLPVMVMVELKEGQPRGEDLYRFTPAIPFTEETIYTVDEEILNVFPRNKLITPDDVRKGEITLEAGLLRYGWPGLNDSRGKILFALDNTGNARNLYLHQSDILENRLLFVSSAPGEPSAAFIKMNNSLGDEAEIRERAQSGYLIRTRSDIPMTEAPANDHTRKLAAFRSGAQYVSTDFPEPAPSGFTVQFEGLNSMWRCNPVTAPEGCMPGCLNE
ncbi:MAG: hypothetical protein EA364_10785 [Balneolaceae bacterium]|nr:MAG: hypothetical protein EA364_10785 [Balneolaceae bacterium]